jgi:uncharacterized membrane protein (UPF0127 family)
VIYGSLYRENKQQPLLTHVMRTDNITERIRGLLGRPELKPDEGLLITPCNSIHTAFMAYPIDLLFLDQDWTVKKMVPALRPWRMAYSFNASMVLELMADTLEDLDLNVGRKLSWEENTCN